LGWTIDLKMGGSKPVWEGRFPLRILHGRPMETQFQERNFAQKFRNQMEGNELILSTVGTLNKKLHNSIKTRNSTRFCADRFSMRK